MAKVGEDNFNQMMAGVEPIKRKSRLIKSFKNQANFLLSKQSVKKSEQSELAFNQELINIANNQTEIKKNKSELKNQLNQFENLSASTRLEFRDHSVSLKQMRSLKAGKIAIQTELDLHGYTKEQAEEMVNKFLEKNHNCSVLIIHGKGYNSTGGQALLKSWLNHYLKNQPKVRAFCSAIVDDGGTGAVYVLLK